MHPDLERIISEIEAIKEKLDHSHDTDIDYLHPLLRELRTYILQVHASYEKSLEILIWRSYSMKSESPEAYDLLFERMTFYDKQKIVHKIHPNFPDNITTKLNELRNAFAHKKGETIRFQYSDDSERLKAYKLLENANDALSAFWGAYLGKR